MRSICKKYCALGVMLVMYLTVSAQPVNDIKILAGKPVADIKPTMWGVFFEDINFAADGGVYAELVKNRSFEFSLPLMGWRQLREKGNGRVVPTFYTPADESNPRYIYIVVDAPEGAFGLMNEGFRGMGIRKGENYNFSVKARVHDRADITMRLELTDPDGKVLGEAVLTGFGPEWRTHKITVTASETEAKARMRLMFTGRGRIDIDMVSLFPSDTWKGRPGGLRRDLVEMIADLKPGFLRFPGGCIVEGRDLTNRYQWKTTVGPVEGRRMIMNRWNVEIRNRQTPDYFQSFGLGFFEYFQLAEDLGAEPLPILNCGMSCQFNAAEVVPLEELDPYIQDALDLIAFANGPVTTEWGRLRASMGHPEPFNLKYIGIGNEQWEEQYFERYRIFEKVLKEKHPEIMIVSGSGPYASGDYFDYAWQELRKLQPDLVDEHYYMRPEWFLANATRYDNYDRNGPKIFAGEYAAHGREADEAESRNSWYSALAEAAFMTGLERNADIVHMASYAPLLAHVEAWQWRPDLIWFDNLNVTGTPNYYVHKLFSNYSGTHVVQALSGGIPLTGADSIYASAVIDQNAGKLYIKLVNSSKSAKKINLAIEGVTLAKTADVELLTAKNLYDFNSITNPKLIFPSKKTVALKGRRVDFETEPISLSVLIFSYRK